MLSSAFRSLLWSSWASQPVRLRRVRYTSRPGPANGKSEGEPSDDVGLGAAGTLTVKDAVRHLESAFRQRGIPEPDLSAQYLVLHAWQSGTTTSLADLSRADVASTRLTSAQIALLERLKQRRLDRMSVQHCVGEWDFHNITLSVRPPTLVPRPETEELVDLVLHDLRQRRRDRADTGTQGPLRFLEVGCGSGCISLALLSALPHGCTATALDVSENAVELTQENARSLGLEDRIEVLNVAAQDYVRAGPPFDLVVSNPPYIPSADMAALAPEVLLYEDHGALDGGEDGLDVVRTIMERVNRGDWLVQGGTVWLEVDLSHPLALKRMLRAAEGVVADSDSAVPRQPSMYERIRFRGAYRDFSGRDRFVCLQYVQG